MRSTATAAGPATILATCTQATPLQVYPGRTRDPDAPRYPSRDEAVDYRGVLTDVVDAVRNKQWPTTRDTLVWPEGLDRRILAGLPLPETTRRCLQSAGLMEGDDPRTVYEFLCTPGIGRRAIHELVFALDAFLTESIERFEGAPSPVAVVAMRLSSALNRLTPRERAIIELRVLRDPPMTFDVLGAVLGVSATRVQQLQARAQERIDVAFGSDLGPIVRGQKETSGIPADEGVEHRHVDDLLSKDLGGREELVRRLFSRAVINEMGLRSTPESALVLWGHEQIERLRTGRWPSPSARTTGGA